MHLTRRRSIDDRSRAGFERFAQATSACENRTQLVHVAEEALEAAFEEIGEVLGDDIELGSACVQYRGFFGGAVDAGDGSGRACKCECATGREVNAGWIIGEASEVGASGPPACPAQKGDPLGVPRFFALVH
jgi:hypothetical protein